MLDLVERLALGVAIVERSAEGTEFHRWPDTADGYEWRYASLPGSWFKGPSRSDAIFMEYRSNDTWTFFVRRDVLADLVSETIRQVSRISPAGGGGPGSVSEIRYATLRRLVTAEEWRQAEEAFHRGVADGVAATLKRA